MKAPVLFLLSICFFLLVGESYAHGRNHQNNSARITADRYESIHKAEVQLTDRAVRLINDVRLADKNLEFFNVENEDEDFVFSKKSVVLVSYFITLATIFCFGYSFTTLKNRLPFCTHFSYTSSHLYLQQRVLRI